MTRDKPRTTNTVRMWKGQFISYCLWIFKARENNHCVIDVLACNCVSTKDYSCRFFTLFLSEFDLPVNPQHFLSWHFNEIIFIHFTLNDLDNWLLFTVEVGFIFCYQCSLKCLIAAASWKQWSFNNVVDKFEPPSPPWLADVRLNKPGLITKF